MTFPLNCCIAVFLFFSPLLHAQNNTEWATYRDNRTDFPVLSPLEGSSLTGKMHTHFVGLQVDERLLNNKQQGFTLLSAGFRKEASSGQTRCFEAEFLPHPDELNAAYIEVELLAFDVRHPEKTQAVYSGKVHNLTFSQEQNATVRCQIPVTDQLAGHLAFVLTVKPPFRPVPISEYKVYGNAVLFDGPWDDNSREPVFMYPPEPKPQKAAAAPKVQEMLPGYEYNAYGYPIPSKLTVWSRKGSNYAHSFHQNGKYGMKATDGTVLIPARYDYLSYAFGGFMIAEKNGFKGVINEVEKEIIPFSYTRLELIYKNDGSAPPPGVRLKDLRLLAYQNENMVGIVNGLGETVAPFRNTRWAEVVQFFPAKRNENGHVLSEMPDYATVLKGSALVFRYDSAGVTDMDGKAVLTFEYESIVPYPPPHHDWVQVGKDGNFGIFDLHGRWVLPAKYPDGLALLTKNAPADGKNPTFIVARAATQSDSDGLTYIKSGLLDSLGREVLPFEYDGFGKCFGHNGETYFWVTQKGKWGLVNQKNETKLAARFSEPQRQFVFNGEPCYSFKDSTLQFYGMYSISGQQILPFQYKWLEQGNDRLMIVLNEKMENGLVGLNGEMAFDFVKGNISPLNLGCFLLQMEGKSGVINPQGKLLVEARYKSSVSADFLPSYHPQFDAKGIDKTQVVTVVMDEGKYFAVLLSGVLTPLD